MRNAVMLLQDAAHPDIAGGEKSRSADPLTAQIGRRRDPFRRVDENEAVAKSPMQKHRQRGPGKILVAGGEIGGGIEFADVELLPAPHAVMPLARPHAAEHVQVDAVGLDGAVGERTNEVVISPGEVEL